MFQLHCPNWGNHTSSTSMILIMMVMDVWMTTKNKREREKDIDLKVKEVLDLVETQSSTKRSRKMNYKKEEDITFHFARMNVSLDTSTDMNQMKKFCGRTGDRTVQPHSNFVWTPVGCDPRAVQPMV